MNSEAAVYMKGLSGSDLQMHNDKQQRITTSESNRLQLGNKSQPVT